MLSIGFLSLLRNHCFVVGRSFVDFGPRYLSASVFISVGGWILAFSTSGLLGLVLVLVLVLTNIKLEYPTPRDGGELNSVYLSPVAVNLAQTTRQQEAKRKLDREQEAKSAALFLRALLDGGKAIEPKFSGELEAE